MIRVTMTEQPDAHGLTHRTSIVERDDTPWPPGRGRHTALWQLEDGRLVAMIEDDHVRIGRREAIRAAETILDDARSPARQIGTRVRDGGRKGAAAVNPARHARSTQQRAVVSYHAAALRKEDPDISDRKLARELKTKHSKITAAESTIRVWLGQDRQAPGRRPGSHAPRRSTR